MAIIEGTGLGHPISLAAAPVAGTDEVQTMTIGGTPTGGTFKLKLDGWETAAITWSAVNATLLAAITAALVALPNIGAAGVVTAAGTLTAGIGTLTITFSGAGVSKRAQNNITVSDNSMTGTAPTAVIAETTPGVTATSFGAPKGAQLVDTSTGTVYVNTGTPTAPTWTKVGLQT